MKAQGLLAVILIAVLALASTASAYEASVYTLEKQQFDDQFGIELNGAFSMFQLGDVNDYFLLTNGYNSVEEGQFGLGGGLVLLYRSHERFRWTIGYAYLGVETASATFFSSSDGVNYTDEGTATGAEFYFTGNYLIPITERFDIAVGAGLGFVNGTFDRVINNDSPSSGASRYDAKGRGMTARLQAGLEFRLLPHLGINLQGGYRFANIPSVEYADPTLGDRTIYWGSGNRTVNIDFSGAFAELGVRMYFEPATNWFKQ